MPVAVSPTKYAHSLTAFFGSGEADLSELNRCLEQLAACNLNERAEMTNSSATPSAPAAPTANVNTTVARLEEAVRNKSNQMARLTVTMEQKTDEIKKLRSQIEQVTQQETCRISSLTNQHEASAAHWEVEKAALVKKIAEQECIMDDARARFKRDSGLAKAHCAKVLLEHKCSVMFAVARCAALRCGPDLDLAPL